MLRWHVHVSAIIWWWCWLIRFIIWLSAAVLVLHCVLWPLSTCACGKHLCRPWLHAAAKCRAWTVSTHYHAHILSVNAITVQQHSYGRLPHAWNLWQLSRCCGSVTAMLGFGAQQCWGMQVLRFIKKEPAVVSGCLLARTATHMHLNANFC